MPPPPVILNVDDTEAGRYAKTRVLQRAGFTVVEAATGAEALRLAAEMVPALALLDVKLPDMSGLDVCRHIKATLPRTAVLQISATFSDKGARIRGLDAGADSYVTQPIEADELVANVRALLRMRAAEDELRTLNDTLEQRVEERTAELHAAVDRLHAEAAQRELAEAALRQAQKLEAIGQLTGGVAHDFNNLLTIIRASTDLLRRDGLTEERRRRYVDAISDTADRAATLTGQLLSFARRQALSPEAFDAAERVAAIAAMLQTVVGDRVRIDLVLDGESRFVRADPNQFETALINMAANARDAMAGEGVLTIAIEQVDELPGIRGADPVAGEHVVVSIADTGQGIAWTDLPRVFEPFFTTKEIGKGTGLGLSQVYGFAKQSGGDVAVASTPGQGTTFLIYLPRGEAATAATAPVPRTDPESATGRVLLVEDNPAVGDLARQLLEELGYEVELVDRADLALRLLAGPHRFDIVLTDVVMPGMSGIELAHALRNGGEEVPVVLTSGYSDVLASHGHHGFGLLQKPYSVEGLARALSTAREQLNAR